MSSKDEQYSSDVRINRAYAVGFRDGVIAAAEAMNRAVGEQLQRSGTDLEDTLRKCAWCGGVDGAHKPDCSGL